MKFNISRLDSAKVLQALFKHAFVRGMGAGADKANNRRSELSYLEALQLIELHTDKSDLRERVSIDFVHGRPIKLSFDKEKCIVDSWAYDVRHGKYRFLYALLCELGTNSIEIVRKGYPRDSEKPKESDTEKMKNEYEMFSKEIHWLQMKKNFALN